MSIFFSILFFSTPQLFVVYNFIYYLMYGKLKTNKKLFRVIELWIILILPTFFLLSADVKLVNDCCANSALFSPDHRVVIYLLIISCIAAYITCLFRKNILPPLLEVVINALLILGLLINLVLSIHIGGVDLGIFYSVWGNVPIILLLIIRLNENQNLLVQHIELNSLVSNNLIGYFCFAILKLDPILKYPILTILLIPFVISLSMFLVLFGQKPDSIIKAFTETYKHGFSQLDYMCENVECGGHFLCSVGANGHKIIVKPIRYGERNGAKIICTRQLLISNAFEELIQERFPGLHIAIRGQYNKVGDLVHRHYYVFNNKIVSDLVYVIMKPLELMFLLTLYTFDHKPENRIASQYLSVGDRGVIRSSRIK